MQSVINIIALGKEKKIDTLLIYTRLPWFAAAEQMKLLEFYKLEHHRLSSYLMLQY
jgi:hypothetical protein